MLVAVAICGGMGNQREETPECSSQEDNVISGIYWAGEGGFVGIEICEDVREDGGGFVR